MYELIKENKNPYEFKSMTGRVLFDHSLCLDCESKVCIEACSPEILKLEKDFVHDVHAGTIPTAEQLREIKVRNIVEYLQD